MDRITKNLKESLKFIVLSFQTKNQKPRTKNCKLQTVFILFVLMMMALPAGAGMNEWTSNGPEGGYVLSLAISPNYATDGTVFAGTGGGVYKSTDGGARWALVNVPTLNPNVNSLAISPNYATDGSVFAGTGDDGVYKSTDGGASWALVNSGLTSTHINSLAVSPNHAADGTVFAGTYDGVYKSTNGGAS